MRTRLLAFLAGMAALSFASVAQAADIPARAAPPPAPVIPIFTWTGFYVGAQVGYAFSDNGDDNLFDTAPFTVNGSTFQVVSPGLLDDEDEDGFTAGGHVGYNVQFGSFVVGAEADIEWVDVGGDRNITVVRTFPHPPEQFTISRGTDVEFIGSLRGRLGFAWDRALIYATGGLAFASFDTNNNFAFISPFFDNGDDDTEWGWTVGAGVEYAFTNNLTARLEYRFTSFDRDTNAFFVNTPLDRDDSVDFHAVRLGVSYKFSTF